MIITMPPASEGFMIRSIQQAIMIHGIVIPTGTVLDGVLIMVLVTRTAISDFLMAGLIIHHTGIGHIIPGDITTGILRTLITEVHTGMGIMMVIITVNMVTMTTDIIPITGRFITDPAGL